MELESFGRRVSARKSNLRSTGLDRQQRLGIDLVPWSTRMARRCRGPNAVPAVLILAVDIPRGVETVPAIVVPGMKRFAIAIDFEDGRAPAVRSVDHDLDPLA